MDLLSTNVRTLRVAPRGANFPWVGLAGNGGFPCKIPLAGMKKGPEGPFMGRCEIQSRSPPMMPSSASKAWNTLKMSRYRASVALM